VADSQPHLYRFGASPRERRRFERGYEGRGYSKQRADYIYGAMVGKVKREREARAHRHSRGHHTGPCTRECRAGRVTHRHDRRRRR
jgi:hypothetical protein